MFHPVSLRRRSLRERMNEASESTETTYSKVSLADLSRDTLSIEEFTDRASEYLNPDLETFLRSSNLTFALDAYIRSQNFRSN